MLTTQNVNTNPETGLHYGVINAHNVSSYVLDDIMQNGTDLYYAEGLEEAKADAQREWDMMDAETQADYVDANDYIDGEIEKFNDSYESNEAPYEFEIDGVIGVYSTSSNTITVFQSPHVVKASLCSPCYPNAGNLDSVGEDAGSTWAGGPVDTYDVPADWRNTEA